MRTLLALLLLAAPACSGTTEPLVKQPKSYTAHMASADAHSARAEQHRVAAREADSPISPSDRYNCGDTALSDQSTSGGERLVQSVPCWDVAEETAAHARFMAAREQQIANAERRAANDLAEAELEACRGISPREREHSPFSHKRAIAQIIAHRETGTLRGVRIVFKPIPGLTAAWMEQAIACHRAKFERLGEPATYLSGDPTMVADAEITVVQRRGNIEVLVASSNSISARVALERGRDLVRERTAER